MKRLLFDSTTVPTGQHESFQRALSSLAHILRNFPGGHPSWNCSRSSTLNFRVLTRWASKKNMHLVDRRSNIISFKHLINRTVPYQYGLETFILDHHLTKMVRDYTAYPVFPSFWLKGFWLSQSPLLLGPDVLIGRRPHFQLGQGFDTNCNSCFLDRRLSPQANMSLSSMLCPLSHASWETFQEVTHLEFAPGQARLTLEFLRDGLPKRRCILLT